MSEFCIGHTVMKHSLHPTRQCPTGLKASLRRHVTRCHRLVQGPISDCIYVDGETISGAHNTDLQRTWHLITCYSFWKFSYSLQTHFNNAGEPPEPSAMSEYSVNRSYGCRTSRIDHVPVMRALKLNYRCIPPISTVCPEALRDCYVCVALFVGKEIAGHMRLSIIFLNVVLQVCYTIKSLKALI
jgi:hypothetical protein